MLKKLTCFNLLYGASLLVLASGDRYFNLVTIVLISVILLFNWVTLKDIEGQKILSPKNYRILMITTLVIALLMLIGIIYSFTYLSSGISDLKFLVPVIFVRILFFLTVIFHVIKSYLLAKKYTSSSND